MKFVDPSIQSALLSGLIIYAGNGAYQIQKNVLMCQNIGADNWCISTLSYNELCGFDWRHSAKLLVSFAEALTAYQNGKIIRSNYSCSEYRHHSGQHMARTASQASWYRTSHMYINEIQDQWIIVDGPS